MEEQAEYLGQSPKPDYKTIGNINFTTFHLIGQPSLGKYQRPERVIAAFRRKWSALGSENILYDCQFSFCSPKERFSDKPRGQKIAMLRLLDDGPRGRITFALPANFVWAMLKWKLKHLAIRTATKKKVKWLMGCDADGLV